MYEYGMCSYLVQYGGVLRSTQVQEVQMCSRTNAIQGLDRIHFQGRKMKKAGQKRTGWPVAAVRLSFGLSAFCRAVESCIRLSCVTCDSGESTDYDCSCTVCLPYCMYVCTVLYCTVPRCLANRDDAWKSGNPKIHLNLSVACRLTPCCIRSKVKGAKAAVVLQS